VDLVVHEVEVSQGKIQIGSELKDGPEVDWPAKVVSEVVEHYRELWKIDTVVTFDSLGVSGHPNHKQTHLGVVCHARTLGKELSYFYLHTSPLHHKYASWLLAPYYYYSSSPTKARLFYNANADTVWEAMRAHSSQMVWFRKFYLQFSSYVYFNQLNEQ